MKQTRIGIIREAIKAEGGKEPQKSGFDYYADGPGSSCTSVNRIRANEAVYKVPKEYDGLTNAARKRVVDVLRLHPDVKDAYLSRPYNCKYICGTRKGGHLKVVFQN